MYFNSQPHKEADGFRFGLTILKAYFNSQPHKEADIVKIMSGKQISYFNSQPHKEADDIPHNTCYTILEFQLTASQGG